MYIVFADLSGFDFEARCAGVAAEDKVLVPSAVLDFARPVSLLALAVPPRFCFCAISPRSESIMSLGKGRDVRRQGMKNDVLGAMLDMGRPVAMVPWDRQGALVAFGKSGLREEYSFSEKALTVSLSISQVSRTGYLFKGPKV